MISLDNRMSLDMRLITGPLDDRTPLCVILEVARAHRVVYHDLAKSKHDSSILSTTQTLILREAIEAKKVYILNDQVNCKPIREELGVVAWYVNPDPNIEWEEEELVEAFYKLQTYSR